MNKILTIVHQETSKPGLVGAALTQRGYELESRCIAIGDSLPQSVDEYAAVIVFGGPMSANDDHEPYIRAELDWIPTVLATDKPYLGICLGAQLLARVLGAEVQPHPHEQREIGYYPILPAAKVPEFRQSMHVYHWHREGFELPNDAVLLAQGGEAFPNQAFRYGQRAYGFQFHPEITADMIDFWTTNGVDQLDLPGAQPRDLHFANHQQYGHTVERWLNAFLDRWLGLATEASAHSPVTMRSLRQSA